MQFTQVTQFSNSGWQKEFSFSNTGSHTVPPVRPPSASYVLVDP